MCTRHPTLFSQTYGGLCVILTSGLAGETRLWMPILANRKKLHTLANFVESVLDLFTKSSAHLLF